MLREDSDKPKYEAPIAIALGELATAVGQACSVGTDGSSACSYGTRAGKACDDGGLPGTACSSGTTPLPSPCDAGGTPK